MKLSKWIVIDGYCATRVILGTDTSIPSNRIAFIEKSPRIKLIANSYCIEIDNSGIGCTSNTPNHAWIYGRKGRGGPSYENHEREGNYGFNPEARKWCDDMLILLGYELEN